jgi:hypothetical protein
MGEVKISKHRTDYGSGNKVSEQRVRLQDCLLADTMALLAV